jgi:hypothetical protein
MGTNVKKPLEKRLVKKKKEDICIQNKNRRDNCQSDEEK